MEVALSAAGTILSVLLVVLLAVVVLLCLLLFLPFRYKGTAEYGEGVSAEVRVRWLCGFLSFSLSYQDREAVSCFRLMGFDILSFLKRRKERREEQDKTSPKEHGEKEEKQGKKAAGQEKKTKQGREGQGEKQGKKTARQEKKTKLGGEGQGEKQQKCTGREEVDFDLEMTEVQENIPEDVKGTALKEQHTKEKGDFKGEGPNTSPFRQLRETWQNILSRLSAFRESAKVFFQKLQDGAGRLGGLKAFWKLENTQGMVCIFKDNMLHLLGRLKPKVLRGKIIFGTGDPCTTGQVLGAAAILYAVYGKGVAIVPDFEKARLEADLLVKGKISLITLVFISVRIFLRKEWKQFRQDIKQLGEA